ncbi:hypothetical protein Q9189_001851 [Teloschistes chrysophthalmus]
MSPILRHTISTSVPNPQFQAMVDFPRGGTGVISSRGTTDNTRRNNIQKDDTRKDKYTHSEAANDRLQRRAHDAQIVCHI